MHIGRRYSFVQTLRWSRREALLPGAYSILVTSAYLGGVRWIGIPWLPISVIGIAVAFYLGFKNNASYDRLWEARKIWGAIVNASRSWAYSARDLVSPDHGGAAGEADAARLELVRRHVAWLDALRHQLRAPRAWEHQGPEFDALRRSERVPELEEDLSAVLAGSVGAAEAQAVLQTLNPAAHLLSAQSRRLAELRRAGLLDGFGHVRLMELLDALMAEQGKAERIKNFPFPRQYATVNRLFAFIFAGLVPCGMVAEFHQLGDGQVWLTVPFSTLVSWVFLTADRIGEWSENPFEGLANDVPISTMSRAIERDLLQLIGQTELPPPRPPTGSIQY
jgi:putative membrane protein